MRKTSMDIDRFNLRSNLSRTSRFVRTMRLPFIAVGVAILWLLGADAAVAGQIGPGGEVIGRCNLGVTTKSERYWKVVRNTAAPATIAVISLIGSGVFFLRWRSLASKPKQSRRAVGVTVGVLFAVAVVSSGVCLGVAVLL